MPITQPVQEVQSSWVDGKLVSEINEMIKMTKFKMRKMEKYKNKYIGFSLQGIVVATVMSLNRPTSRFRKLKLRCIRLTWSKPTNINIYIMKNAFINLHITCISVRSATQRAIFSAAKPTLWISKVSTFFGLPLAGKCMNTGAEFRRNWKYNHDFMNNISQILIV